MSKQDNLESLLGQMHFIIMQATRSLEIPPSEQAEKVRMKMAVFTYGVASALVSRGTENAEQLYYQYLYKSGLSEHQANAMVERTCNLHQKKEFGPACMQAGEEAVRELDKAKQDYKFDIRDLLF